MYLEKLEIQGFKTFAQKSVLEFLPPKDKRRGITAIVGPNGSGKSNVADSIRWVLGEQSLKLLRGKKSEDVIFSGTEKKARSGFAEATLTLNNEDQSAPIDYTTLSVTRRLYRDGNSEYLINDKQVRLTDIQLLLAQANFGQRTYSVIGQGMVDHILVATPQERKEFFDEAAGVKQFQIKRNQAENKLEATKENLFQAENLLREIEPRLRSLSRQVRKLEEREPLKNELENLGRAYFGKLWNEIIANINKTRSKVNETKTYRQEKMGSLVKLRRELEAMEKEESKSVGLIELQKEYEKLIVSKNSVREKLFKIQSTIASIKSEKVKTGTVSISQIINNLEELVEKQKNFLDRLEHIHELSDIDSVKNEFKKLFESTTILLQDITSPKSVSTAVDPKLLDDQKKLEAEIIFFDKQLNDLQEKIRNYASEEKNKKGKFFAVQREWEIKQNELSSIERESTNAKVELARLETQRDSLAREIEIGLEKKVEVALMGDLPELTIPANEAAERFRRIKTQLELIGTIDPETIKEHEETKTRHDFLQTQTEDLKKAITDLESAIEELDKIIEERTESTFKILSEEFSKYFKQLFDGGHASLTRTESEESEEEILETNVPEKTNSSEPKKKIYAGVEIQATPPGKRLKSINALSGGERALTSIAMICAIMAANPSPFVVLDEVDAALDESNSIKFADIIDELSHKTQFIVISHNRATMHKANVLYGVTIGEDGVSRLLSLHLEDAEKLRGTPKVNV